MPPASFNDLRVLALESRHAREISKLIASYGGRPTVAPAMREVSIDSPEALDFAKALIEGKFDMVIFLTGAGTRAIVTAEAEYNSSNPVSGHTDFRTTLPRFDEAACCLPAFVRATAG